MSVLENETLEQQTNGKHNDFERFVASASQNEVIENNIDVEARRTLDNVVSTVKNRMHDTILTAMDKMAIPRVEMGVRSINGSSGHWSNFDVR